MTTTGISHYLKSWATKSEFSGKLIHRAISLSRLPEESYKVFHGDIGLSGSIASLIKKYQECYR